jgi:short-subunit dehydrogenase
VTQRVTLVTGASSGIGADLARVFARHGHRLALVARRRERLDALADEIVAAGGATPVVIPCDLTRSDAGDLITDALAAADVEIDYLVNNAGFGLLGRAATLDRAAQLDMIAVNVRALTDLSLRFSDSLIRHRGGLLNVASVAAYLPGPGMAVYYATKAYVLSFTEALHRELAGHGVRVTALCPGPVPTEFQTRAGFKPDAATTGLDVASARVARTGYDALMRGKRVVVPGVGARIVPFLLRLIPHAPVLAVVDRLQRRR